MWFVLFDLPKNSYPTMIILMAISIQQGRGIFKLLITLKIRVRLVIVMEMGSVTRWQILVHSEKLGFTFEKNHQTRTYQKIGVKSEEKLYLTFFSMAVPKFIFQVLPDPSLSRDVKYLQKFMIVCSVCII